MGFLAIASWAALSFTQQPSIQYNSGSGKWDIQFTLNQNTDVEVTVLKAFDSSIVRRLVAGKLGTNPPTPLTANTLAQSIQWDGKDELGATISTSLPLLVRVRAGMSVALDKMVDQNPYYFNTISGIAKDDSGCVYVYGSYGSQAYNLTLRQYDANGN